MNEFCFVVERVEWDENRETGEYWEDRRICRAFRTHGAAVRYIESNSAETTFPMKWLGDKVYAGSDFTYTSAFHTNGRYVASGTSREGLRYEIHYVPLD